jgi:anaerobic magnesium-protoporphyrin IX monomethyl ester cyclase
MRVLLISPGHDGEHAKHASYRKVHRDPPPLGLLYIGTALQSAGYDVDILDTHVHENWQRDLVELLTVNTYLWCGISVIIGQRQRNAAQITTMVHEMAPTLPVVWGGTMPTVCGSELAKAYPGVHCMAQGEGESWAIGYSDVLRGDSGDRMRHVHVPFPDWTLLGDHYNARQKPYFHMLMTSRGCPMKCTFCYKHTATGGYRLAPLDDVKRQIQTMHDQTGSRVWTIGDDNFLGDSWRAAQILGWMREKGFYFEEVIGHVGQLTEYIADAMAGVVSTFIFSVESASPRIQRLVKKGVSLGAVPAKMGWLKRSGVVANCSFVFGLPTETNAERLMNDTFMQRVREKHDMVRGVSYVYMPLPGTPMLDYIEKELHTNVHFPIREYEDANFWPEVGDRGHRFRPWMSEYEYDILVQDAVIFREKWKYPAIPPYKLEEVLNAERK